MGRSQAASPIATPAPVVPASSDLSATQVMERVEVYLKGVPYAYLPVRDNLVVPFTDSGNTEHLVIGCNVSKGLLTVMHLRKDRVPPEARELMHDFIARANYGLVIGCWTMDQSDGEVRYESSLIIKNLSAETIDKALPKYVGNVRSSYWRYYPGIRDVIAGILTPAAAVEKCESDGYVSSASSVGNLQASCAKHFDIVCDYCGAQDFTGKRYQCKTCTNYNICEQCFQANRTSKTHEAGHEMLEMPLPEHKGVTCDGCGAANFFGIRYKCVVCTNYDLCILCKRANKQTLSHVSSHRMMTLERPASENLLIVRQRAPPALRVPPSPYAYVPAPRTPVAAAAAPRTPAAEAAAMVSPPRSPLLSPQRVLPLPPDITPPRAGRAGGGLAGPASGGSIASTPERRPGIVAVLDPRGGIDPNSLQVDFTIPSNRIGKGGMGEVWLGTYCGATVAVKILPAGSQTTQQKNFADEVAIHRTLQHPCVVQMYGFCSSHDTLYLVQEYCSRKSLDGVLRSPEMKEFLTPDMRKRMAIEACQGMLFLHTNRILHLDLKPANLLVTESMHVKVGDFGLSECLSSQSYIGNFAAGSLLYMAPELFSAQTASRASDVYSFGVLLYEVFTGLVPFQDLQLGLRMMVLLPQKVMSGGRPAIPSDLDPRVAAIIKRCWHQDPLQRPAFSDILVDLQQLP